MDKLYIPIKVNGKERWHMDISNLTLSELIQLRDELIHCTDSVSVIDGIIKTCHLEKVGYKSPCDSGRSFKKIRKREKYEMKRKCKERKDK